MALSGVQSLVLGRISQTATGNQGYLLNAGWLDIFGDEDGVLKLAFDANSNLEKFGPKSYVA